MRDLLTAGRSVPHLAALGALLGSAIGSLFGGGDKRTKFSGAGGLGQVSGGDVGAFIQSIDQGIQDILNTRQQAIVDAALRASSVSVRAKDFDQNVQAFAASQRVGVAAQALGFNANAITGNGQAAAQTQLQNLQTALELQRTIEDLTHSVTTFDRQSQDLADQFADITAKAKQFGVSIEGLAEAQTKAAADLQKQQDAQIAALLDPIQALKDPLTALKAQLTFTSLNPAAQFQFAQQDFERIAAEALGGDLSAIGDFAGAAQLFLQQADRFGASPSVATATAEIQNLTAQLIDRLDAAQTQASAGIEDVLDRFRRENTDKLDELIDAIQEQTAILKRRI